MSQQLDSGRVLVRFTVRLLILVGFAAFSGAGFGNSLAALLSTAMVLCGVVGLMKRETRFGPSLNHWDEGVAFGALFALVGAFDHLAAV